MEYELKKPYTEKERCDFIVKYNHNMGLKISETENGLIAKEQEITQEETKQNRIAEIQTRLDQLSQDIVQDIAGEFVPDIEERKAEFVELHNKLRGLLGKEEREIKGSIEQDLVEEEKENNEVVE